ncbi:MoxR-like ATPase [Planoprotostelium fungivorum]|uniref:magnesium chelatase n=1 Tax=Planoprotostelium fungivorum TaxID=1890364 RepID=A0A2P6NW10_9EUKA|nr:MoxR-like ATPase [Planoprotostelium fungivorum]
MGDVAGQDIGLQPYHPKRDEYSQRFRNLIEQTGDYTVSKNLYYSLLYCIITKGHLLIDVTDVDETESSSHGPGFDIQHVVPAFVGLKCGYLACTPNTTPNHITQAFFREHMSASIGKENGSLKASGSFFASTPTSEVRRHGRSKSSVVEMSPQLRSSTGFRREPNMMDMIPKSLTNRGRMVERSPTLIAPVSPEKRTNNLSLRGNPFLKMVNLAHDMDLFDEEEVNRSFHSIADAEKTTEKDPSEGKLLVNSVSYMFTPKLQDVKHSETKEMKNSPILKNKGKSTQITQILIIDRIESASPQTLAALMETQRFRHQGTNYQTPDIFIVVLVVRRVLNGCLTLSGSQVNQFTLKINLKKPLPTKPLEARTPVLSVKEILCLRLALPEIYMGQDVEQYIRNVVYTLRNHPQVKCGITPSSNFGLKLAARAVALIFGQAFVTPSHALSVAANVLAHRITPVDSEGNAEDICNLIVNSVLNGVIPPL